MNTKNGMKFNVLCDIGTLALIHGDVVCFDRYVVPPKYILGTHWENHQEIVSLQIPKEDEKYLEANKIICVQNVERIV